MPGRVTGTIGTEEVRLENAATESTLELLVEVMNDAAKKLGVKGRDYAKELKGLKSEAAARDDLTDKIEEEEDKRKDLNKELDNNKKKLKDFAEDLDGIMQTLSAGIGKVFSDATPTVGGFAKAFSGIPIVGSIISTFGEILDNNIKTYRNLASAGIDFGKGMYAAQVAAANAGMPLEVFAKTVAENSQALQTFGGTASQGAQIFANVLGGMKKSGAQQALGRLGMSMDEVSENTMTYMEIQARNGRAATMTQAELQQGALEYNLELDKMARATGLNRKQIDDANKAMARDAKLRVAMARMSEKDQVAWNARIKQLQEAGMTDQAEGLKDLLASGGAAVTKNSAMLVATNQGFAEAAQAGFRGVEGSSEMLRGTLEETSRRGKNLSDEQRQQAGILMNYNKSLPGTIEAGLGGLDFSSTQKAAKEQAAALSDPTKNLAAMDQALVDVQNNLKQALLPLLEKFGNILITTIIPALEKLAGWLEGKSIGEILLAALVGGIGLMFAKAAASKVLENAIEKLLGSKGGIDIPGGGGGVGKLGKVGKFAKGAAVTAAVVSAGGALVDTAAGALGAGGKEIDEKADEANWKKFGMLEKAESGVARAIEHAADFFFMDNLANEARSRRIEAETKYLEKKSDQDKKAADAAAKTPTPEKPVTPEKPEKPTEPATPKKPAEPAAPEKPVIPAGRPGSPSANLAAKAEKPEEKEKATATPVTPKDDLAKWEEQLKKEEQDKLAHIEKKRAELKRKSTHELEMDRLDEQERKATEKMSAAYKDRGVKQTLPINQLPTTISTNFTPKNLTEELKNKMSTTGIEGDKSPLIAAQTETFKSLEQINAKLSSMEKPLLDVSASAIKPETSSALTDMTSKLDQLNSTMMSLVDIQGSALRGIDKTAKYTKQSTGNMIG